MAGWKRYMNLEERVNVERIDETATTLRSELAALARQRRMIMVRATRRMQRAAAKRTTGHNRKGSNDE